MSAMDHGLRQTRAALHLGAWMALIILIPAMFLPTALPGEGFDLSFSLGGWFQDSLPSAVAVTIPGLAAAWFATGGRGLRAGLRQIAGVGRESEAATAVRALASASRATMATGLVLAISSLIIASAVAAGATDAAPAFLAEGITLGLLPPAYALLIGRCALGACASNAASRAGERHGRTQRGWAEVSVPLLLVMIPAVLVLFTLLDFRVLNPR
ncbi:hypothetical protein [Engelhardtia mirabilis]|uniref:Uncharacterized protein n=1 Tax=Engelhardtia mirabilis TaxID=2528011 RepID=A0A518BNQ5_9BACT|nr:hypothetical protein Pla133_37080 [Planctomycetes bacterium Pla133]QDV02933.1 hypothetical protein Pla86_37060 [Planctomycetes bacterium Pla86]